MISINYITRQINLLIIFFILFVLSFGATVQAQNRGYISNEGTKFIWTGTGKAFIPNFVMLGDNKGVNLLYWNKERLESFLDEMFCQNGFNGVHVPVYGQWFQIGRNECIISDTVLDLQTFEKLKMIIQTVYEYGGATHIWAWGDAQRSWSPASLQGGIMGATEKKVWDKIYVELNDLKGWTVGYGFDLFEWVNKEQLKTWYEYCHAKPDWKHLLGARAYKNKINQIYDGLDFNSYENHKPRYAEFRKMVEHAGNKPAFSADRFRVRGRKKDPTEEFSVSMMWDAAMAGGVAGIWGYLDSESGTSGLYPNVANKMLTFSRFWKDRFLNDLKPSHYKGALVLSNGLQSIYYKENTISIAFNVLGNGQQVTAVNADADYEEICLGQKNKGSFVFNAPSKGRWVVACGF